MYDLLLRGENAEAYNRFWPEFFLLRPKITVLESEIHKLSVELLSSHNVRRNINALFEECVTTLGDDHHIRIVYALQTLCGLVRATMKKRSSSGSSGFDTINLLIGFDTAEQRMRDLVSHLNQ